MNKKAIARALRTMWLLPLAALVGCSGNDDATLADGQQRVAFSVSTDRTETVTRGIPLNELDGEFGLFCAQYTGEWGEGQPLNYMYNEMVIGSGNTWTTAEGYFVPARPYLLKFFAYYPYYDDVNDGTSPLVMFGDKVTAYAAPSFTYTMPTNAEDQQDLMYAISGEEQADATGKLGTVHMNFHHLLTAITIAAKGTDGGTIKRVTLKGLYSTGEFEFRERDALNPEYGVLRAERSTNYIEDVYADLNMTVGTTYKQADDGLSFMLILQPVKDNGDPNLYANAKMEVLFAAKDGKDYTFTKSLSDLGTALTQSRHTLLQLSVESFKKITVKATITDWGHGANFDGAVSDQPVLELEPLISDWDGDGNSTTITTGPNPTVTGYTAPTETEP